MNKTISFAFIALFLVQITLNQSLTCPDGQVLNSGVSTAKCTACPIHQLTCQTTPTFNSKIVGYGNIGSTPTTYCPVGTSYYNKATNNCEQYCK